MSRFSVRALRATLFASAILLPAAAHAEEATAPDTTPATPEIVVTARYRNEALQQVPIAITAVTGQSLNDRAIHNLQDLSASVPTVDFRNGASNKDRTIFIRGVGTITTSPGVEASVSTVLDGVVLTRPGQATLDLGEVERIEVLRGPQGTLFGKNASAGVINIVTKGPSADFGGYVEGTATTDQEYRAKIGLNGALSSTINARIDGLYTKFDGNVYNRNTKHEVNGFERYGARAKLNAEPTETLKLSLEGDYIHSRDTTPTGVYVRSSQIAYPTGVVTDNAALATFLADAGITPSTSNRDTSASFDTNVVDDNYGGSLTAELALGDYHLTSITAYRGWKNKQDQDYDTLSQLTPKLLQGVDNGYVNSRQFSQELRLTSPKGQLIDYVVGAYYLRALTDERYQRAITRVIGGAPTTVTGVADYGVRNSNYALFGEANINFSKNFRAIAGYRSTWDDLSFYHTRTSTNDPAQSGAGSLDVPGIRAYHKASDKVSKRGDSYRLGLQLDLGSHAQTYFTYSRGYKGPAYNVYFNQRSLNATTLLDEIPLNPETSKSFEAGIKGSALGRSVSYALALYTTDFNNYQANYNDVVAGAQVTRLINAGTVRSRGIELDLSLRPTKGFTIDTALAHTDAKVIKFICPVGAPASCAIDGQPLPFAPRWKVYTSAAYRFPVTDSWDLELQSDLTFKSATQYQLTQTPATIQPAYALLNASVALLGSSNGWQLRAYVKNIANEHYSNFLGNGTIAGIVRFVPRDDVRFGGLTLRKEF